MNTDYNDMSKEDLERLADAFFNSSLERHEEADLARVLAFSDVHTPQLDSCRRAMGLEYALKRHSRPTRAFHKRGIVAAASIAVLAAVSVTIYMNGHNQNDTSLRAEVYMSGKRISDEKLAVSLARRDMESELKAFRETMEEVSRQKSATETEIRESKELINQINNSKL